MTAHQAFLVERAVALRPFLLERAPETEKSRRIGPEIMAALDDAGILDTPIPRRWGGAAASALTIARIGAELAKGCPSTAWVYWVLSTGTWLAGIAPDAVQEDVFGAGRPRFCGSGKPGRAEPVEGGYRVTGRWGYASGSHHAAWIALGGMVMDGGAPRMTNGVPELRIAYVRPSDVEILDTWHVAGLRATGSNDVTATDVFVPAAYTAAPLTDEPVLEGATYAIPLLTLFSITLVPVALGIARRAIEEITGYSASHFIEQIRSYISIIHPDDRPLIEQTLDRLRDEMKGLPAEPVGDAERLLLRAFYMDGDDEVRDA